MIASSTEVQGRAAPAATVNNALPAFLLGGPAAQVRLVKGYSSKRETHLNLA
jgi:hypothetical protein